MAFVHAVALTGGIASGKSTVAALLRLHGLSVIDVDVIAHTLLETHATHVQALFGDAYATQGNVNRRALGALVFDNGEAKTKLERWIHPLIREVVSQESTRMDTYGVPYIVDIPLYFEAKEHYPIKRCIVVYVPVAMQRQRLMQRSGMDLKTANARIKAQLDMEYKRQAADFVIDNTGNLAQLQEEVQRCLIFLKEGYDGLKI